MEYKPLKQNVEEAQLKSIINVTNQSKPLGQSEIYNGEILQMFTYLNNLITKISIEKEHLMTSKSLKPKLEEKKNDLRERVKTVHEIIDQLTGLINIEKSCLLLIKNTKDQHKQNNLKDKVNWMEKSINLAILRYNELEKVLNIPSNKIHTEIKNSSAPFELTFISKKRRQEIERQMRFKETQLIITDLRSPMQMLKSRVVDHGIAPTYRFLGRSTSGQHLIFNYSCTLFGMYVEGSGTSKYKAKENAATEMLHSILKKQKNRTLSSHIRAFNEKELKAINPLIKYKANYVEILEKICIINKCLPPIYNLLFQTKKDYKMESHYSIQCNALDFVAIGHSNKRSTAKQIAAKNIINLWIQMNSNKTIYDKT